MAYEFGSEAWAEALRKALNSSPEYRSAAANWEGDFYFICAQGASVPQDMYMYFDLWHGECRMAQPVEDPNTYSPAFELTADLIAWKKIIAGELDPIKGIVTRQLKLKGNMVKVLQVPRAAMEMVKCATSVETIWPA